MFVGPVAQSAVHSDLRKGFRDGCSYYLSSSVTVTSKNSSLVTGILRSWGLVAALAGDSCQTFTECSTRVQCAARDGISMHGRFRVRTQEIILLSFVFQNFVEERTIIVSTTKIWLRWDMVSEAPIGPALCQCFDLYGQDVPVLRKIGTRVCPARLRGRNRSF